METKGRVRMRSLLVIVTIWPLTPSTAASLPGPPQPFLVDVTEAVGRVDDGYVSRIILQDDGQVATFISGSGQVCYDGWLIRAASTTEEPRQIIELGPNSHMAKADGVFSSSPSLVAAVGPDEYVFNVNCDSFFPHPAGRSDGATGNVVHLATRSGSLTNLTDLSREDGRYAKALAWVDPHDVLVIEESRIGTSEEPSAMRGTGRPMCFRMPGFELVELSEYPDIEAWLQFRDSIIAPMEATQENDQFHWTIKQHGTRHEITLTTSKNWPPPAVYTVKGGFLIVTDWETGTELVRVDGSIRVRLSEWIAVDVDEWSGRVTLRSPQENADGKHRYGVLDVTEPSETAEDTAPSTERQPRRRRR